MLFFVLSGFVLTLPYTGPDPKKIDTVLFTIRRIARLYPAYWVALTFALALKFFVFRPQGLVGLSEWANMHWLLPITGMSLLKHFSMISPYLDAREIDPVIWSMMIEMKISLVFPAILMLVQRTAKVRYAILVLALTLALGGLIHGTADGGSPWLYTITVLPVFLMGSYLAKYKTAIVGFLGKSAWIRAAFAIAGIILYNSGWLFPALNRGVSRLGTASGSAVFVMLFLASSTLARLGASRPVVFMGNVSYSFYLIQLPILLATASVLYPLTSSPLLFIATSLACSLLISWVIYVRVEIPGQNLGKRIGRAFNNRMAAIAARGAA
jgi:peptidoglycan/LPS O-acetylase OafA/YrhL